MPALPASDAALQAALNTPTLEIEIPPGLALAATNPGAGKKSIIKVPAGCSVTVDGQVVECRTGTAFLYVNMTPDEMRDNLYGAF